MTARGYLRERLAQRRRAFVDRQPSLRQHFVHREESVNHAVVARDVHRNAGGAQLLAVRLAFVAQRINSAVMISAGGKPLKLSSAPARRADLCGRRRPQVVLPEIDDVVLGQKVVGEIFVRVGVELGLGRGIDEELERDLRAAASRASCEITADRFPPALSPPTASRFASAFSSFACAETHLVAAKQSSTPAGNLCSGASR